MSLYLPRWAMERRGGLSAPEDVPAVLVVSVGSRRLVSAVNQAAEALGLRPGLALADARAQVPGLAVAPADPAGDAAALLRLAQWCGRYSPWTVPHGPDCILLDITGCAHLTGGERRLGTELVARLARRGITARIGIADTVGGAWAMARAGEQPVEAIAPGTTRDALAPLTVRALRLDDETVAALERLGLRRIGDLYALPRADLAARFDAALLVRLDEALGEGREALSPLPPMPPRWARRSFAEPIATPDDIAAAIRLLLEELCRRLAEEALGGRLFVLTLHRVDGESASVAVGTARPSRDAAHLLRLFAERIERIDPGFGIEDMVLAAKNVEPLAAKQLRLSVPSPLEGEGSEQPQDASGWGVRPHSASPPTPPSPARGEGVVIFNDDASMLIDRLANRLGARSVGRLVPHAAHLPERAQRFLFAFAPMTAATAWDARPRPVRLLPRPEPIEAMAPVPDDPPLSFRWRRRRHRIVRAEGPERIMGEWWRGARETELLRDYYRVEDEDGRRYWLFRAGLYQAEAPARWFMHGLCA
jgi:protein ImuB